MDAAYRDYAYHAAELEHSYGDGVHLLSDPLLLGQLADLCEPSVTQPRLTEVVRDLYRALLRVIISSEFPRTQRRVRTRMHASTPMGMWSGQVLDPATRVVTAGIARAGTLPSQIAFELLSSVLNHEGVRQDHIYMNRVTDDNGAVTGVSVAGSKIGGDIDDAMVLLPDPMGATGSSMARAVSMYKDDVAGTPRGIVVAHLIVTPEYVRKMQQLHPDVKIYALRLDRGLSPADVLESGLGMRWDEEKGLNEVDYIDPGAGGVGELLNNSFV